MRRLIDRHRKQRNNLTTKEFDRSRDRDENIVVIKYIGRKIHIFPLEIKLFYVNIKTTQKDRFTGRKKQWYTGTEISKQKERKKQFGNFSEGIRTNKEKLKVMFRKRNKEKLDKYREKELKVIGKE